MLRANKQKTESVHFKLGDLITYHKYIGYICDIYRKPYHEEPGRPWTTHVKVDWQTIKTPTEFTEAGLFRLCSDTKSAWSLVGAK